MHGTYGWSAYPSGLGTGGAPEEPLRPELADVGRLARRGMRAVVGAARAQERPKLSRILGEHLGAGAAGLDVMEETWRPYDLVNVQAGLDAWLVEEGRTFELVGVVTQHGQPVSLAELLTPEGPSDPFGPRPGNAASLNVACGPDGQVRPCVRCGLYLITEEGRRTAVLLRAATPEFGREEVSVQVVSMLASTRGQ